MTSFLLDVCQQVTKKTGKQEVEVTSKFAPFNPIDLYFIYSKSCIHEVSSNYTNNCSVRVIHFVTDTNIHKEFFSVLQEQNHVHLL